MGVSETLGIAHGLGTGKTLGDGMGRIALDFNRLAGLEADQEAASIGAIQRTGPSRFHIPMLKPTESVPHFAAPAGLCWQVVPAISVLLPLPIGPLTYWAPEGDPATGRAVVVSFQGRLRVGVVLGSAEPREAQSALIYLGESPWLGQPELDFILAAAEELFCPPGLVFQEFFPYFEPTLEHKVRLSCDSGPFTPAEGCCFCY